MAWLTDWDDLIHGTAIFSVLVPLVLGLLIGYLLRKHLWIGMLAALLVPLLWFFGLPAFPPHQSDHILVTGLLVAAALITLERSLTLNARWQAAIRVTVWTGMAWALYPAWLSQDESLLNKWMVTLGMGVSITAWASLMQYLVSDDEGRYKMSPLTLIPPTVTLAILLQFGGAIQFAQCAGALTSALFALGLVVIYTSNSAGLPSTAAIWGMLFGLLAWSGWLFAEIHITATLLLLLAPIAALASKFLPLPRTRNMHKHLWDTLSSALIAILIAWIVFAQYSAEQDTYGY